MCIKENTYRINITGWSKSFTEENRKKDHKIRLQNILMTGLYTLKEGMWSRRFPIMYKYCLLADFRAQCRERKQEQSLWPPWVEETDQRQQCPVFSSAFHLAEIKIFNYFSYESDVRYVSLPIIIIFKLILWNSIFT